MNRYPAWKYAIIVVALLIAALYTLPNFFGEAPAVQVSSAKSTVKVDSTTMAKVEQALKEAGVRRRRRPRWQFSQGAVWRYRHPAQGQGCNPEELGAGRE
jgi:hypothetical protein